MAELVEQIEGSHPHPRTADRRRALPTLRTPGGTTFAAVRAQLAVRSWTALRRFLFVLAIVYLAKQAIYVFLFPPFSGHDEVAHYAYLRVLATEGRIPVIPDLEEWRLAFNETGTGGEDRLPNELYRYCRYTTRDQYCAPNDVRFREGGPEAITWPPLDNIFPSGWIYTANHPPLFYVLLVPLYWLTDGASPATQLYLFRFAAIPFGLATVLLAYLTARVLFPRDRFIPVVATAFVAFQPQVSYEAAMLNNDIVGIALYSLALYLLVLGIRDRFPVRLCVWLGVVLGLAMLTKGTSLTAVGIAGIAILGRIGFRDLPGLIRRGAAVGAPLVVLAAPWYVFLYRTYGNLSALPQIRDLQYWNEPAGTFFGMLFDRRFAEDRFHETWGQWGWRLIPLSEGMLWGIGLPLFFALLGFVWYVVLAVRGGTALDRAVRLRPWQAGALGLLVLTCVVAYLAIIQFGVQFSLTQARYFFPAVNAAAIILAVGARTLVPVRLHAYGQGLAVGALVLMNVLLFSQFVIPYWHFSFD